MKKEEKNRLFESEALILPALKMVLVENENNTIAPSTKNTKKKASKDFTEETIVRIIGKLSIKD